MDLAKVAQKVDNAINWMNHCPVDSIICFVHTYTGQSYLPFENLGPEHCQNDVWIQKINLKSSWAATMVMQTFLKVAHLFPIKWSLNVVIVLIILDNSALFCRYHLFQVEELFKKQYQSSYKYLVLFLLKQNIQQKCNILYLKLLIGTSLWISQTLSSQSKGTGRYFMLAWKTL